MFQHNDFDMLVVELSSRKKNKTKNAELHAENFIYDVDHSTLKYGPKHPMSTK